MVFFLFMFLVYVMIVLVTQYGNLCDNNNKNNNPNEIAFRKRPKQAYIHTLTPDDASNSVITTSISSTLFPSIYIYVLEFFTPKERIGTNESFNTHYGEGDKINDHDRNLWLILPVHTERTRIYIEIYIYDIGMGI